MTVLQNSGVIMRILKNIEFVISAASVLVVVYGASYQGGFGYLFAVGA